MRNVLLLAMAALLPEAGLKAQQQPPVTDGLSCFVHLVRPEYPQAALQAHVDGSVWAWIQVNAQGVPEKIDTQVVSMWPEGAKLLTPVVEQALRASRVKPECAGKTVRAVIRFQYDGEKRPDPGEKPDTDGGYLLRISSSPAGKSSGRP